MKRSITLLMAVFLLWAPSLLRSQELAITEIMYNDPSGGTSGDSLEFVEIMNLSINPIDLAGFAFTAGITYTFPSVVMMGQERLIIAKNSGAVDNFFGISGSLQWDAGQSLSNNGEAIVLKDAFGHLLDSVRYFTAAPWPTTPNGYGGSLLKCDPLANANLATSWSAANITNANMYNAILGYAVFATPLLGCLSFPPYDPLYALLPFTESFDSDWINGDNLRDVPSVNWKNLPATGNNSWRRSDDGISALWTGSTTGAYTPAGALGTSFSARFHTAGTTSGGQGIFQFYVDLSVPGIKNLKFWYNNSAGTDSLSVYMSENSGITFSLLQKYTSTTGWEEKQILLGTSMASKVVIRFVATSNYTANDIGIDQISVITAPDNDAGIAFINSPVNLVFSSPQAVEVTLRNFGNLPLTSVDINWAVDGVPGNPLPWQGNLASGAILSYLPLGSLSIPPLTLSQIKTWTSNPNGVPDGDASNDTLMKNVFYQTRATIPFYENFDSTWVNKFATRDCPDSKFWINTPATGNASWRRNDDGASAAWTALTTGAYPSPGAQGTIHSARFHTSGNAGGTVGIFDLYLDFSTSPGAKELKFYHVNTAGNDSVAVWISYDNGATFSFLNKYTTTPSGNWELRVIDLGNSNSDQVVLRFRATSNQGGNTDPGIDEISISQPQPDMAMLEIVEPVSACDLTATESVTVRLKNTGSLPLTDIPVIYHLDGTTVQETINTTLQPGDILSYTFLTPGNFQAAGPHQLAAKVTFPGDYNPLNDSLAKVINTIMPITSFPFTEDFESGNAYYFSLTHGTNANVLVEPGIGNQGSSGLRMTGNVAGTWPSGSGGTTTATQAWNTYTDHHGFAMTCTVDGTALMSPELRLDLRQTYITGGGNKYNWFRVLVNDTVQLANSSNVLNFNPVTQNSDPFVTQVFDLTAFAQTQFKITLQSSCKYSDAGGGSGVAENVFIDNYIIRERPPIEIAMKEWISPSSSCDLTNQEHITVSLKNQGTSALGAIPVSYSIDNGLSWVQEMYSGTLEPDSTLVYAFTTPANFSASGIYNCLAVVSFSGDADLSNDTIKTSITSIPYLSVNGFYLENFEQGTGGWSSGSIEGKNEWEFGTPATTNLNSAHSGSTAWVTGLTQNYSLNSNSYVLSPCFDFTGLNNPYLSVWLRFRTENNYDAMIMEVSVNDSSWYKIVADTFFYNNYSTQPPVTPPKWSGNNNAWTYYMTSLPDLANKTKVQIRFRFVSDYTIVDEGVAIDDIAIFDPFPDASVTEIISPVSGCNLGNTSLVSAIIKNTGLLTISDIPVNYAVNLNPPVFETIIDTLEPGETTTFTFSVPAAITTPGVNTITVWTSYIGDLNVINDTFTTNINNSISFDAPVFIDFNSPGFVTNLALTAAGNSIAVHNTTGGIGNSGCIMLTGGLAGTWPGGSDTTTTADQAWSYADHLADLHTCTVTIPSSSPIGLWVDLKQTSSFGNKYSWFRVLINDTLQIPNVYGVLNFNPVTPGSDPFTTQLFDLTPYGPDMKISLQASCKYSQANSSSTTFDAAFLDNFRIDLIESLPELKDPLLTLYPNPATDQINLVFSSSMNSALVEIINIQGQTIMTGNATGYPTMKLDISSLPSGIYAIRVLNGKETTMKRFVKAR